jgi:hypothetical protein
MSLTGREREIVSALALKIRILAFDEIIRCWWPASKSAKTNAQRRLSELVENGLLTRERAFARPRLPLTEPVFRWKPGDAAPDIGGLSYRLQSRWTEPPREITVYLATKRAAAIFGGRADGRIKNPSQVTHDIHLGALYLKFLREAPTLAAGWIGEDILAPTREQQKLPDAILHDAEGRPRLVVEFGGSYPRERVEGFHEDCEARELPYELW